MIRATAPFLLVVLLISMAMIVGFMPSVPAQPSAEHDVAISSLIGVETIVGQNYTALVLCTLENQGNYTETFNVTAYYDGLSIFTEQWPGGAYSQTFWSMGDAVRDGYIDLWDGDLIAFEFGWNGPPGENPADLNSDGAVDLTDTMTWGLNFGLDIWTFFGIPKQIRNQTAVTLPSGHTAMIAFRWNTTNVSKGSYLLSAEASIVPGETDLTDNAITDGSITVAMIGDITGPTAYVADGKVDIRDVATVAQGFGVDVGADILNPGPGAGTWLEYWHAAPEPACPHHPNTDLTGDTIGVPNGKIDIKDVATVAKRFGQTDP